MARHGRQKAWQGGRGRIVEFAVGRVVVAVVVGGRNHSGDGGGVIENRGAATGCATRGGRGRVGRDTADGGPQGARRFQGGVVDTASVVRGRRGRWRVGGGTSTNAEGVKHKKGGRRRGVLRRAWCGAPGRPRLH